MVMVTFSTEPKKCVGVPAAEDPPKEGRYAKSLLSVSQVPFWKKLQQCRLTDVVKVEH